MIAHFLVSLWALDATAAELVDLRDKIEAAKRLPAITEAYRLPDAPTRITAQQQLAVFLAELDRQRKMAPPWGLDAIEAARGDCFKLQYVWSLVEKAQDDREQRLGPNASCWTLTERRQALDEIRREIGDAAFWQPVVTLPMVPYWHVPQR